MLADLATADKSDVNFRIDCGTDPNANEPNCDTRGCIVDRLPPGTGPKETPSCFLPREEMGYRATKVGDAEWKLTKNDGLANPFGGGDLPSLKLSYSNIGNSVFNIRIEDATKKRFETGELLGLPRGTQKTKDNLKVVVADDKDPFSFAIQRANGQPIFDTSPGGLIYSDKFIQLAVALPTDKMYGWGENVHPNLKHDFTRYTKWAMFARDEGPDSVSALNTKNLYGVHPFYLAVEADGKAHGVLFLNSNAQDLITVPAPGYVYRTIGGILDIYVFPGPTPAEVVQQYTAFVGRPFLPPYWALGFQLCRYGYKSLDEMKARVAAVRNLSIPFDVAYADIDYMDRKKDFTIGANWSGFADYVTQLHDWEMRSILIFDPAIQVDYDVFERAIQKKASFIEWERPDEVPHDVQDQYPLVKDSKILLSVVWPDKHVAFPDFLDPETATGEWWRGEFQRFHDQIGFDGAWIDMNEPAAFGTNEEHPFYFDKPDHPNLKPLNSPTTGPDAEWEFPPYKTQAVWNFGSGGFLAQKTVCMGAMSVRGSARQYDVHSLYGWSETRATQPAVQAATGKRGVVISRSTFPSSGRFGGHWLGDNSATWQDLRSAVIGVMEFNLFGIPYVGSDVGGFNGASSEELCLRWQQLGSFHSFYRNHNSDEAPDQDPAVWPSVAAATKKANEFRYAYLPYLYTLHYKASLFGDTVIRPLFFDFGSDTETHSISEQFMWGPAILVIPVLKQGAASVTGYVPTLPGVSFYSLYDHRYGQRVAGGNTDFPALTTYNTPTLVRSGSIIPRMPSAVTTVAARKGDLNLLIVPGEEGSRAASGEVYWDDGDSIVEDITTSFTKTSFNFSMTASTATLSVTVEAVKGATNPALAYLEIFGYPGPVSYKSFKLNGEPLSVDTQASECSAHSKILQIVFRKPIDISGSGTQTVTWEHRQPSLDVHATQRVPA